MGPEHRFRLACSQRRTPAHVAAFSPLPTTAPRAGGAPRAGRAPVPAPGTRSCQTLAPRAPALKGLCCSQPAFGSRSLFLRLGAITQRSGAAYARFPCSAPCTESSPGLGQGTRRSQERETPELKPSLWGISHPMVTQLLSASCPTPGDQEHTPETCANLGDRQITCALSMSPIRQPYGHINHSHHEQHQSEMSLQ